MEVETDNIPNRSKSVKRKSRSLRNTHGKTATGYAFKRRLGEAWDMYCDGVANKQIAKHLDISYETLLKRYLKPQEWSALREKFRKGEAVDPPWVVYPDAKIIKQKPRTNANQSQIQSEKRQKAFVLYCRYTPKLQIAEILNVPIGTLYCWSYYGKWSAARKVLEAGGTPQPEQDIPNDIADMITAQRAMNEMFKHTTGEIVLEAMQHVKEKWTPDDVLDRSRDLMNIATISEKISDKKPEVAQQINIMQNIEAIEDHGDFDVKLEDD